MKTRFGDGPAWRSVSWQRVLHPPTQTEVIMLGFFTQNSRDLIRMAYEACWSRVREAESHVGWVGVPFTINEEALKERE